VRVVALGGAGDDVGVARAIWDREVLEAWGGLGDVRGFGAAVLENECCVHLITVS
jgi:hypothetical protein